jgi:predicted membrane protein
MLWSRPLSLSLCLLCGFVSLYCHCPWMDACNIKNVFKSTPLSVIFNLPLAFSAILYVLNILYSTYVLLLVLRTISAVTLKNIVPAFLYYYITGTFQATGFCFYYYYYQYSIMMRSAESKIIEVRPASQCKWVALTTVLFG